MPLGSAKYIPPVSSLNIRISSPDIISGLSDDASTKAGKTTAGLKLANKSISFLNFNKPFSGLFSKSTPSYFGLPTAPNNTASASIVSTSVSSVKGVPYLSYEAPPTRPSLILKLIVLFLASQSTTLNVSLTTSGPTPSPGKIIKVLFEVILNFLY